MKTCMTDEDRMEFGQKFLICNQEDFKIMKMSADEVACTITCREEDLERVKELNLSRKHAVYEIGEVNLADYPTDFCLK